MSLNRFRLIKALLMNTPVSLTMAFVAQAINVWLGHMPKFDFGGMAISFLFSYFAACVIAYFIPTDHLGFALAEKMKAQKGSWAFDIWVNLVVNTIFCVLMTLIMTWFSACLIGGAPLRAIPSGFAETILPVWIACFIVSLLAQRPALRLAKKCCGMQD